ncbi:hypothetical protein BpHYR1_035030 [Brachionus plicatilis]|uniref:Uncharacterized protein n=1 Tax=Brachionus plicatilis TaxID=10195 RepID=A0A3M7PT82_BRAPC|nr:hypothetical protein BpHYR1_035030 [Brachionus plicatilis]
MYPPLTYNSSFTTTSSPRTLTFSILTFKNLINKLPLPNKKKTYPFSHIAPPAHNRRLNPTVRFDRTISQNSASLYTNTILDNHIGSNYDIGTNPALFSNFSTGINHHIAHNR